MQKSAQHSSHWYQDVQSMLPLINGNSLGWRIYRAPHLPSGFVWIGPGWDVVALERSQGMATCQWEGFLKQGDVEVHCQSDLPFWCTQLCTGFVQSLTVPPLNSLLPGRFAQHSLGHQRTSLCHGLGFLALVRLFVDADEALSKTRRYLQRSILKSCYAVRSCEANVGLPKSMSQENQQCSPKGVV